MNKSILKPIVMGILFGGLAYLAPFFLLKAVLFFFLLGALFRFFFWRKFGRGFGPGYHMAFVDNIRNMSEEEYAQFKNKFQSPCGYPSNPKGPSTIIPID